MCYKHGMDELTAKTLTLTDLLACWDRSKCGDPDGDPPTWDSDMGWSIVTPEDARLAMSSVPIFGVGDLQGYWRSRDAARQRCADAINAARRSR